MREELQPSDEGDSGALLGRHAPHLEDVVGTDADAVGLRLAAVAVDDGRDAPGLGRAAWFTHLGGSVLRDAALEAAEPPRAGPAAHVRLAAGGDGARAGL